MFDDSTGGAIVASIYDPARQGWAIRKLLAGQPRRDIGTVGDKLILAGGWSYEADRQIGSPAIDIYNAVGQQWSSTVLSEPRWNMTVISADKQVFFAGGQISNGSSPAVEIYNDLTGQWSVSRLSQARTGMTTAVVGSKIVFAGGSSWSPRIDIYDGATGQWSMATLSERRLSLTAVTIGPRVLLLGGIDVMCMDSWIECSKSSTTVDVFNSTAPVRPVPAPSATPVLRRR
jgi:hypothetical protein